MHTSRICPYMHVSIHAYITYIPLHHYAYITYIPLHACHHNSNNSNDSNVASRTYPYMHVIMHASLSVHLQCCEFVGAGNSNDPNMASSGIPSIFNVPNSWTPHPRNYCLVFVRVSERERERERECVCVCVCASISNALLSDTSKRVCVNKGTLACGCVNEVMLACGGEEGSARQAANE